MQEVLVNRLGGLSLPMKSVVRLTDRPNMTSDAKCRGKLMILKIIVILMIMIMSVLNTLLKWNMDIKI